MILRNLVKDSAIYGGADLATKVVAFLTFPLIAAALSPEAFGVMELIGTVTALLGMFANCGLNNGVQRFYWDKDTQQVDKPAIVTSGFLTMAVFTFGLAILGILTLPWITPLIEKEKLPISWISLVAALFVMVFTQLTQYTLDVIRLHFMPWRFLIVSLSSRVLSIFAGLLTITVFAWGVDGLLAAQALVMFVVVLLALYTIRQDFKLSKFDWKWVQELTKFGYPFIFAGIAYWLFGVIDRWMLASMTSIEEVGIYSVSFRFAAIVFFVSGAFGQAWSPFAIKVRTDHPDRYRVIYGQVLVLLFFIMLVVGGGVSLFSGEMIRFIMPEKYAGSAAPLAILCFGVIIQASQQVTAIGISLEKKTYLFARLIWVAVIVNTILSYLFIPRFGALGAAWATSISHIVLTAGYTYFTQKIHPLKIAWRQLGVVMLMLIIFLIVSVSFNTSTLFSAIFFGKLVFYITSIAAGYFLVVKQNLKLTDV